MSKDKKYCCDEFRESVEREPDSIFGDMHGWYLTSRSDMEPSLSIKFCPFCGTELNREVYGEIPSA